MGGVIDHNEVEAVLRASGSSWTAAQAHGLLCSRLAVLGAEGGADWLGLLFENSTMMRASLASKLSKKL